ncbi:hypothetical protein RUM4293_00446 [Ruegeria atlantica]|uniref:Uncharacterized protein n=1 Tax=Ruegeria atlantica TaxID=81569 RepID=A0A0N7LN67_9RHOB|nr:hypothetical protein RUM4293_00446 [Ruegeria atlantica]
MIRLGSIIAWIAVILGSIRMGMGWYVASQFPGTEENLAASKRYLATANSGDAIDQGTIILIAGVVIGLLVRIAKRRSS